MRATIHLVGAKDFLALRPALQPMLDAGLMAALRDRAKGLDPGRLAAYGPASLADIQAWSGAALRDTVESLRPRLRVFRDEGRRELFDLPGAPRPPEDVHAPVRLVPEYDNLITARTDDRFVSKADRPRVYLSALRIAATVLVDGRVAGTWSVERKKSAAVLTIAPFAPLPAQAKSDALAEADALLRFVEPDAATRDVRVAK